MKTPASEAISREDVLRRDNDMNCDPQFFGPGFYLFEKIVSILDRRWKSCQLRTRAELSELSVEVFVLALIRLWIDALARDVVACN